MTGPGRYAPDPTEGITRVEDLPKAKIVRRQRSFKRRKCPHCGHSAYRDKVFTRTLHDLGDLAANRRLAARKKRIERKITDLFGTAICWSNIT